MIEVGGGECFHFQRTPVNPVHGGAPAWQVGETYEVGAGHNRYFDFFYRQAQVHRQSDGRRRRPLAQAFGVIRAIEQDRATPPAHGVEDLVATLRGTTTALQSQCNLVRELVFEAVRQRTFPARPSRHRCIWLAPSRPSMQFWDRRGPRDKTWFRVQLLAGRYHLTDAALVRPEYQTVSELEEQAHHYWAGGHDPRRASTELMFIGTLKVLEALGPPPSAAASPA